MGMNPIVDRRCFERMSGSRTTFIIKSVWAGLNIRHWMGSIGGTCGVSRRKDKEPCQPTRQTTLSATFLTQEYSMAPACRVPRSRWHSVVIWPQNAAPHPSLHLPSRLVPRLPCVGSLSISHYLLRCLYTEMCDITLIQELTRF
jgi:hypothetical protein